jgi:hypothetical protein
VDAVRLSLVEERPGVLQLRYVLERDCSPVEFGDIEYQPQTECFTAGIAPPAVRVQAAIWAASYERRRVSGRAASR